VLIHLTRKEQLANANLYLSADGLAVTKHMIQASFPFLETLETWISQQYNDLLGQGGSEKDCWEYVCHCVPEIFSYLHEARLPGLGFLTAEERPVILWALLHTPKRMEELTKKQFSAHLLLSPQECGRTVALQKGRVFSIFYNTGKQGLILYSYFGSGVRSERKCVLF
jgi:hypothetical protein